MVTPLIPIVVLGVLTSVAMVVAYVALRRARAARAALCAADARHRESAESAGRLEAGSRLAGDVAHDLNDLLTAITGHTELLIASLDPSGPGLQDAQEIRRAALSAARLTKSLRNLGGHRGAADVVDVNAVTARTASALERMLGPNSEVTLTLDNDIERVKIGAAHLEEIVLNLGIYARDAMPDGGRLAVATTMHIADEVGAASGTRAHVRMVIADSGGGMSEAAQSRLFEPFLATDDAAGRAMGLARIDAIVKEAGGRIQVESTAGVGTTFTIDLPATSEAAAATDPARADTRLQAPVLVVEDDPRVRELIAVVLVRAGHEVVSVSGSHAALAELMRQPAISLMLVDVVMPEMDGYDLMIEARKISHRVQVVFMSGFARDAVRHPIGDGFLAKPFTVESLTGIVQQALAAP
jgi:two-component system, cell cycle sensor histidine kinase and response regulator CckA